MVAEDKTGRERKERLRARRDEVGLAQVSGWVPKDRRPYAREVLAALAQGANSLPPDPEQAAALKVIQEALAAAQAEAATARIEEAASAKALLVAQEREHVGCQTPSRDGGAGSGQGSQGRGSAGTGCDRSVSESLGATRQSDPLVS